MIALSEIKLYDIILIKNNSLTGRLIRLVTGFKYNHVLLVVEYMGEKYVADATSKGFYPRMMLDQWLYQKHRAGCKIAILRENRSNKTTLPARSKRMRRIRLITGTKYDKMALAIFHLINQITGKYLGSKSIKRVVCSEAIAYIYLEYFPEYWKATPKDIYNNPMIKVVHEDI